MRVVISILLCLIYRRVQVSLRQHDPNIFTRYNNFIAPCLSPATSRPLNTQLSAIENNVSDIITSVPDPRRFQLIIRNIL